ncbi:MAG TPA: phosphodiester glycosidase family protein [Anaerolineae bacterium]|jgi:uncharacterized protein YigE (DUF2233 family)
MKRRIFLGYAFSVLLGLTACSRIGDIPTTPAPANVTTAPLEATAFPTLGPTATSMTTWQTLRDGIEYVQRREPVAQTNDWVTVVRVDMAKVNLRINYSPDQPLSVRAWYDTLKVDGVINAGFFTEDKKATGIVISNGKRFGQTYKGFGGMFSVRDGKPFLQWLSRTPYVADDRVTQALQSFPMLIINNALVDGIPDDGSRNRRSFIAIDRNGRVLLGTCQSPIWTMSDLAQYLYKNPLLNIASALNLDGGASSGIWLRGLPDAILMDSLDVVPTVISISAK